MEEDFEQQPPPAGNEENESDDDFVDALEEEENVSDNDIQVGDDEDSEDENAPDGIFQRLRMQFRPRIDMDSVKNRPSKMTYDASLPTAHSYLGSDLEEYSGRTVLDDNSYVSLPLLSMPGVILTPGQTLPLHLFHQRDVSMVRSLLENNRTFGMIYDWSGESVVMNLGTTAEIISCKNEDEGGIENVKLKAVGRQRFKVMETRRQINGILIANVKILQEREIPDVLDAARLKSVNRLRLVTSSPPGSPGCHGDSTETWRRRRRKAHYFEARCTRWPAWVYEMYDSAILIQQIKSELRSWYEGSLKLDAVPSNPIDFSYWIACKLPLEDHHRIGLLQIESAVQRLRAELYLLKQCTVLNCKGCRMNIAKKSDVFSMSLDGPMAAYVNPGGHVHETLTLYRAQNLNLIGRPSTENSWFPGYAWTILQCRRCSHHMGWKFTAVKSKLKPEKFWGLTRSSLQTGLTESHDKFEEKVDLRM